MVDDFTVFYSLANGEPKLKKQVKPLYILNCTAIVYAAKIRNVASESCSNYVFLEKHIEFEGQVYYTHTTQYFFSIAESP